MWTPATGNLYYNLEHHCIAGELNHLNGASVPSEVQDAFDDATDLFNTYTPSLIAALKRKPSDKALLRQQFIDLTGIVAAHEGIIGRGHCSEDASNLG